MSKREYALGTLFTEGGITYEVVVNPSFWDCAGCAFDKGATVEQRKLCQKLECTGIERKDKRSVYFVEVENKEAEGRDSSPASVKQR